MLMEKTAVALVFQSAVGWLLVEVWSLLILEMRLEEVHLRNLLGPEHEAYTLA